MEQATQGAVGDWQAVRAELRERVGSTIFESWLKPLEVAERGPERVVLSLPSEFHRKWVATHYADLLHASWHAADSSVREVALVVADDAPRRPGDAAPSGAARAGKANGSGDAEPCGTAPGSPLEEQQTFETFVVGASNEYAQAAARRVAESRHPPFNPLFFTGGVGLGKTHLMNAIAWEVRRRGERRIVYMSAERFTTEFVRALRYRDTDGFKEKYRSTDVLMVDDVQFIASKIQTQEEFFHTFDTLANDGKQIVVSGDRAPVAMEDVDERLRSRLGSGVVAELGPTTYELRLGILESKAALSEGRVAREVMEFLAEKITSDVRELTGAFTRIVTHAELVGRPVDLDMARGILKDLLRANARRITIEEIQGRVADHFGVRRRDMTSSRRSRAVARPRQVAIWLCKQLTQRSLPDIGGRFNRDHTTVIHAIRKVDALRAEDPAFAEDVDLLLRQLEA